MNTVDSASCSLCMTKNLKMQIYLLFVGIKTLISFYQSLCRCLRLVGYTVLNKVFVVLEVTLIIHCRRDAFELK